MNNREFNLRKLSSTCHLCRVINDALLVPSYTLIKSIRELDEKKKVFRCLSCALSNTEKSTTKNVIITKHMTDACLSNWHGTLRLPTATCSATVFFEESERNRETSLAGNQRQGVPDKTQSTVNPGSSSNSLARYYHGNVVLIPCSSTSFKSSFSTFIYQHLSGVNVRLTPFYFSFFFLYNPVTLIGAEF